MRKKITLAVVGFIAFIILLTAGGYAYRYLIAPVEGAVGMREDVQSADFRRFSYEYFYNAVAEIKATEAELTSQEKKLGFLDRGTDIYNRTLGNIAAIEAQIVRLKAEYNANVQKEGTRGQFKSNDLPDRID